MMFSRHWMSDTHPDVAGLSEILGQVAGKYDAITGSAYARQPDR